MLKFHFASSAIFDPQRETNLSLLSCVTLFKQLSLYKKYINNNGKVKKELNSPVTNQLSSYLQLKEPIKLFVCSWLVRWVSSVK